MEYYLDPDYRKLPKKDDKYCIRCQKSFKDADSNFILVSVNYDTMRVKKGWTNEIAWQAGLIGNDCWKIITQ